MGRLRGDFSVFFICFAVLMHDETVKSRIRTKCFEESTKSYWQDVRFQGGRHMALRGLQTIVREEFLLAVAL